MSLSVGARLGPYEVTAKIGEGGMGEVYRATDTSLDRQVAIKVLPDAFASDAERLARFEREAKVLASLNHPNIGAIYGLEKSGDTRALVLELVEGPTLADRIKQGPIPVDEVLAIAKQIAEALEAAHEQGIIHRDLKPANVKVKDDGTVKVLDFGLAKAVQPDVPAAVLSDSPTVTATVGGTRQGVILGTAAYMSPEQARGKPLDRRTDIWSFGCVLYEMLAGRAVAVATPWVVAALLAVTAGVSWTRSPVRNPLAVVRTSIPLPTGQRVPGIGHPLAISPNGRTLAYITEAGTTRLYLRSLDETDVRLVPQTDGARQPFFSPDSEWVGFWADGILYRVPVTGGQPLPTAEVPEFDFGAAWGPRGTIILASGDGLRRVPDSGGTPVLLGTDNTPVRGSWPQFLPTGGLLVVSDGRIVRLDLETLEVQTLWDPLSGVDRDVGRAGLIKQARYLPSGHLVYAGAGDIIAIPFDLTALEVHGAPIPVAQDVFEGARSSGAVYFASADNGTMVFVNGGVEHRLVLVDRSGRSRPLRCSDSGRSIWTCPGSLSRRAKSRRS